MADISGFAIDAAKKIVPQFPERFDSVDRATLRAAEIIQEAIDAAMRRMDRNPLDRKVARAMAASYARGRYDKTFTGQGLETKIKQYVDEHWQAWSAGAGAIIDTVPQNR